MTCLWNSYAVPWRFDYCEYKEHTYTQEAKCLSHNHNPLRTISRKIFKSNLLNRKVAWYQRWLFFDYFLLRSSSRDAHPRYPQRFLLMIKNCLGTVIGIFFRNFDKKIFKGYKRYPVSLEFFTFDKTVKIAKVVYEHAFSGP